QTKCDCLFVMRNRFGFAAVVVVKEPECVMRAGFGGVAACCSDCVFQLRAIAAWFRHSPHPNRFALRPPRVGGGELFIVSVYARVRARAPFAPANTSVDAMLTNRPCSTTPVSGDSAAASAGTLSIAANGQS